MAAALIAAAEAERGAANQAAWETMWYAGGTTGRTDAAAVAVQAQYWAARQEADDACQYVLDNLADLVAAACAGPVRP